MNNITPSHPDTYINPTSKDWVPKTFDNFLSELDHIISSCQNRGSLVVFRGHSRSEWLLDSTFVRSCKAAIFGLPPMARLSAVISDSIELHFVLLNLFLLKFGVLVRPSSELEVLAANDGIDAWFELMKRYQQFPEEDLSYLKGSHLLDWTQSSEIALYFANYKRSGEGAVYICDATATGETLQIISVGEILERMDETGNAGKPLGCPLLFHPQKQILCKRANNQQAVYFAQMDLRYDLEAQWRLREREIEDEKIIIKLVLPSGCEKVVEQYLLDRGITNSFIYPNERTICQTSAQG